MDFSLSRKYFGPELQNHHKGVAWHIGEIHFIVALGSGSFHHFMGQILV